MTNVPADLRPDLCILGGSAAGLTLALEAAARGLSVALVGKDPTASRRRADLIAGQILRAAGNDAAKRRDEDFGAAGAAVKFDFAQVRARASDVAHGLGPQGAQARLEAMNVNVLKAQGRFVRPDAVDAGGRLIKARRFVVAPAAQPKTPSISGLDLVRPIAAAELLRLERPPVRLIVIGGEAQGLAVAQGLRRLGGEVAVVAERPILADEDQEMVEPLRTQLARDGVVLREAATVLRVEPAPCGLVVFVAPSGPNAAGKEEALEGSHLFIASEAIPAVEGLGLAAAGVRFDARGVKVGANLRASNRRVYAIGATDDGEAESQAYQILRHMFASPFALFAPRQAAPRVRAAWTNPEVAFTGLSEAEARKRDGRIRILRWPYANSARAQIEGEATGHVKLITSRAGKILGAAIVGSAAGELINLYTLSIWRGLYASDLAAMPVPYPCFSEAVRGAARAFDTCSPPAGWRTPGLSASTK
jgi:pyruvate/2-oxoglutarate dehydrogenase complex dihydrolipoamide dehydrogenase (E3) component